MKDNFIVYRSNQYFADFKRWLREQDEKIKMAEKIAAECREGVYDRSSQGPITLMETHQL